MDSYLNKTVCVAIPCLCTGGTEVQTLNLVNVLVKSGYNVTILCYFEYVENTVNQFKESGAKIILLGWNRSISSWVFISKFRNEIIKISPLIVHVQYMNPGALPIIATKLAGVRTILATVHQPWTSKHGWKSKLLLLLSSKLCKSFLCVSKNAEISWFGSGHIYANDLNRKITPHMTVYNAVDTNKIKEINSGIDSKNTYQNTVSIGVVSRLTFEKGVDILVESFSGAFAENPNIKLFIVGSGSEEKRLKDLIKEKDISENCVFAGEVDWIEAMSLMSKMDIVVVPSRFEGFGLSAAEAMAMGKAVIASNVNGLSEVIVNNETGVLFKSEDTEALKAEILKLSIDDEARLRLGNAAQLRVSQLFDIEIFHKAIKAIYNNLLPV